MKESVGGSKGCSRHKSRMGKNKVPTTGGNLLDSAGDRAGQKTANFRKRKKVHFLDHCRDYHLGV